VIASLLLWLAAIAGMSTSTPHARSSFEIDAPSALVVRTICIERATITLGAPSLERRAPHARSSSGALACTLRAKAAHALVRGVLLERPRARLPHTLRRTYDAHAPPRAIDRV
jgi:predicted lysophospholipase L1 biosynthesis ABC-type transport system permease subunit